MTQAHHEKTVAQISSYRLQDALAGVTDNIRTIENV